MVWVMGDDSYELIIKELDKQTDRGAVLIATSLLENQLERTIKTYLNEDKEVTPKVFKGYGPLATFSAKIDIGFLMGLYIAPTHKNLHRVRDIRNEFAHNIKPIDFKNQKIKALSNQLIKDEEIPKYKIIGQKLPLVAAIIKGQNTPRQRFLKFIKIQILQLVAHAEVKRRKVAVERGESVSPTGTLHIVTKIPRARAKPSLQRR